MDTRFFDLNNSVMFNLSLSSKELFHSNFLSYLFNYDNSLFCKIIGSDFFEFKVKRERKNIDIEIAGNYTKYIIENKIKDIIDNVQIEKIENCRKENDYDRVYLFSLLGNNLEMLGKKHPLWEEIGYEKIIAVLKEHKFNDIYLELLKNDYCNFLAILISLLKEEFENCNKYILHRKNNSVQKFEAIRLHDLYFKYGMSHFANYFIKNNDKKDIQINLSMNRANATMTFSKQFNGVEYGIETEDTDYRRYIIGDIKSRSFFETIGWFDKNWKSASGKEYLKYDHVKNSTFWYQNNFKNRIIENITYNELLNFIRKDIYSVY